MTLTWPWNPSLQLLSSRDCLDEFVEVLEATNDDSVLDSEENARVLETLCYKDDLPFAAIAAYVRKRPAKVGVVARNSCYQQTPFELAVSRRLPPLENGGIRRREEYPILQPRANYEETVLCLIQACPEAVFCQTAQYGGSGGSTLDLAVKANAPVSVLRALLMVDPSLATPDGASASAVKLVGLYSRFDTLFHYNAFDNMDLVLLTHFDGHMVEEGEFLLHAASQIQRMPEPYFQDVVRRHPEQASMADPRTGNLPLHFLCSLKGNGGFYGRHTRSSIKLLLGVHPQAAAVTNSRGQLPLHIAIKANTHDDSYNTGHDLFEMLVAANSDALRMPDPETGLVPYQEVARDIYQPSGYGVNGRYLIFSDGTSQAWDPYLDRIYMFLRSEPNTLMNRGPEEVAPSAMTRRDSKRKRRCEAKENSDR